MPNPKTKTVCIDGHEYFLAPLKMRQIEELVESALPEETVSGMRKRLWGQIEASMKNSGHPVPDIEELRDRLDLEGFLELLKEMRAVSKLYVPAS